MHAIMPAFVFERRHAVELEAGFILAGQLVVDIPKRAELKERHKQMISQIVQQLTALAQSGQMPDDGLTIGWHGGCLPPNAVDTNNHEVMNAWVKNSVVIGVRVDPRNDGYLRIDSDQMRQITGGDG